MYHQIMYHLMTTIRTFNILKEGVHHYQLVTHSYLVSRKIIMENPTEEEVMETKLEYRILTDQAKMKKMMMLTRLEV